MVWTLNPSAAAVKRPPAAGDGPRETEQERAAADASNNLQDDRLVLVPRHATLVW